MKTKRIISFFLALVVMLSAFGSCLTAFAARTETQFEESVESTAWLQNIAVSWSTGSMKFEYGKLKPVTDYPYTKTQARFEKEVGYWVDAYKVDENTRFEAYLKFLEYMNMAIVMAGGTDNADQATMRKWLTDHGIVMPPKDDEHTDLYVSLLYAMMKNNMYVILFPKMQKPEIPAGTPLEKALNYYLIEMFKQEGVVITKIPETVKELMTLGCRITLKNRYGVENADELSDAEVYRLMTVKSLQVDMKYPCPDNLAGDDLDRAYLAAMLMKRFSIEQGYPIAYGPEMDKDWNLKDAFAKNEIPKLVLRHMVIQKGKTVNKSDSTATVFKAMLSCGYYDIENQFYCDVPNYTVDLPYKLSVVKVRPVTLYSRADMKIDGSYYESGYGYEVKFKEGEKQKTVKIHVEDPHDTTQKRDYTVTIKQGTKAPHFTEAPANSNPDNTKPPFEIPTDKISDSFTTPDGQIHYIDENGQEFTLPQGVVLVTDENGFVLGFDDSEAVTDEAGNYVTVGDLTTAEFAEGEEESGANKQVRKKVLMVVIPLGVIGVGVAIFFIIKNNKDRRNPDKRRAPKKKKAKKKQNRI